MAAVAVAGIAVAGIAVAAVAVAGIAVGGAFRVVGPALGPATQSGTHAPSVLWRRTTVSTDCPQAGQTCCSLPMTSE
ncbi:MULTISPECIES: hypothetical protein [unclassified Streptomyces]|uniref:hypothetical protein n=1 Tax=unclassified Streptomyces TaxID=2593676 RepID=UPI0015CF6985